MMRNGRSVLALLGALLITACAEQERLPLSPGSGAGLAAGLEDDGSPAFYPAIQREGVPAAAVDAEVITSAGGELRAGGVTLRIPPGALDGDVTIRMIVPGTPFLYAHFQPHGLRFGTPATLTFDLAETDAGEAESLLGVYVGSGLISRGLSVLGSETYPVTFDGDHAAFEIDHFSGYIVASGRSSRGTW